MTLAPMKRAITSTLGKKIIMGISGLLLIGFVIIHLSGNFLLYVGFADYNHYAHTLHSTRLIYIAEIGLLVLFVLHIYLAFQITRENRLARPVSYQMRRSKQGQIPWTPSAVMFVSGAIVLAFILLHLADFRFELRLPGAPGEEPAFRALRKLQNPISASVYFIGSLFLGWHLWHGFQSVFQTFGFNHPKYTPWIKRLGFVLAIAFGLGFASFPVWAFFKKLGVL